MIQQVLRIKIASTSVGCVLVTPELAERMRRMGLDPYAFNRVRWPVGASNHASGDLLISSSGLASLVSAGFPGAASASIELGDLHSPITLTGMQLLPPRPLLVDGIGAVDRIYAIPVTCRRYQKRSLSASQNYNLLGRNRSTLQPLTISGGTDAFNYDQVGSALASAAGLTWTVTSAVTGRYPVDVRCNGLPAAQWIDALLAESGRVYVLKIDGSVSVEFVDVRSVFDVLSPLSPKIIHGGVRYARGSAPTTFLGDSSPVATWSAQEVPATVRVVFPSVRRSVHAYNDPWVHKRTAAYTASDAGLVAGNETVREIHDNWPVLNPDSISAPEIARAEAIAQDFYRRYRAGALEVLVAGIVSPLLGGACQEVEWICDGMGFMTVLRSRFDWPGYGFEPASPGVLGGDATLITRRASGFVQVVHMGEARLVRGKITARATAVEAQASDHLYKADSLDGVWSITSFQAPLCRPYNGTPIVSPPAINSECLIWIDDVSSSTPTPKLWQCQEKLVFEECDAESFVYGDGGPDNSSGFMVDRFGRVVVNRFGNVVVDRFGTVPQSPEDHIVTDRLGQLVFDRMHNAVLGRAGVHAFIVSPAHYNRVVATRKGASLTTLRGRQTVTSDLVDVAPPADIAPGAPS